MAIDPPFRRTRWLLLRVFSPAISVIHSSIVASAPIFILDFSFSLWVCRGTDSRVSPSAAQWRCRGGIGRFIARGAGEKGNRHFDARGKIKSLGTQETNPYEYSRTRPTRVPSQLTMGTVDRWTEFLLVHD